MKTVTSEFLTVGAWGLHLSSFIMASMPYLQALSLILAIAVSIFTLRKLVKDSYQKRKQKNDKIY
jgi:ABC-type nickel/cobalt efflux system permease component RcnA